MRKNGEVNGQLVLLVNAEEASGEEVLWSQA